MKVVPCDKFVPVTTAWCVLRLWMEERPPVWRVAANILNKQSWTTDKGWSSSLGVGRGSGVPRGGLGVQAPPPREIPKFLTKLIRIPSSEENTSVTTLDIPRV
jgi:hypothetical protein